MNTSETRYFSSSEKLEGKQRFRCLMVITGLSTGGAETMLLKLAPRLLRSMEVQVVSLGSLGEIGPNEIGDGVLQVARDLHLCQSRLPDKCSSFTFAPTHT